MRIFTAGALARIVAVAFSAASAGCGGDDPPAKTDTTVMQDTAAPDTATPDTTMPDTSMSDTMVAQSPCERAGGAAAVASVVYNKANAADPATLVGTFAGNCKINQHFLTLGAERLNHTGECLAIQVQELFGCAGVTYAGSMDSLGAACRDMKTTHTGLAISKGNFDALIADVVSLVSPLAAPEVGVLTEAELNATAAALLSLEADILEQPNEAGLTLDDCAQ